MLIKIIEEISSGKKVLVAPWYSHWMWGLPSLGTILNGKCSMSDCSAGSSNLRPMIVRCTLKMVLFGFVDACCLAASPMRRSVSVKATHDGVVRLPWLLVMISQRSCCQMPTQLQVVPRSIPTAICA